ncbi:MAG TPA: hypothetical protein VEC13_03110 [Candidatus Paceibacterota bacterium]|nr:hypothetical protein [Candidatus Paceibacterota bacterium]
METDEDLKAKIDETYELSLENNKMLRSIQKRARWSFLGRLVYWIIILGVAVGAFYYVKPYVEDLIKVYDSIRQTESKIQEGFNSFNFFKKETQQ